MTDKSSVRHQVEHGYPPHLHGQKMAIRMNGNPREDAVSVNGEPLKLYRDIEVRSDMHETEVTLTFVHLPSGGEIVVGGYLVSEEDYAILEAARKQGVRP